MADEESKKDAVAVPDASPTETASTSNSVNSESTRSHIIRHEISLHSDTVRPLVGLELPVYGSDMSKVLETVNGLVNLQQAHETKSQFLPVKLRPSEPSCKPLFADLTKTQMILLRVKRSKRKRREEEKKEETNDTEAINTDGYCIKAEVAGLIKEKYVCEGMADFQYFTARSFYPTLKPGKDALTVVANTTDAVETAVMNSAVVENGPLSMPSLRQRELQDCLRPYLAVENETQLEMIPEVFSKVDLPLKYEFRQRSGYQPTTTAKKTSSTMTYLNFHDDTAAPVGPKPERPVVRRRSVGVDDNGVDLRVMEILQGKLEQKPVWLRSKLFDGLDAIERRAARRLLRKFCYVFVDGPWRGSWIKMGYDPRLPEESESASRYQVVELRNNRELVHSKVTHATRKRIKKFVGASSGNANGEGGHVKGPRIVKVTQTSALENAQAAKRRRKERFTRGETRRSYLVEPTMPGSGSSVNAVGSPPRASPTSSTVNSGNDWESEDEQEDKESDGAPDSADNAPNMVSENSDKIFEIFGVQLASPNVLFQLDEIDDDEVREWTAQFTKQATPSLLGGWYPTQMFLPLREIIRLRIAAMVGRSKAELDTRRKRLDALKKQALSDYAEELAGRSTSKKSNAGNNEIKADNEAEEDEELAFERSLIEERNAGSKVEKLAAGIEAEKEDEEEEDLDDEEENDSAGRSRVVYEDDMDEEEQEDTDEQVQS
ncbi:RNA polymerase III transcription factor (TF)IIIC subunit HTH domain [Phytophthora infestans]|uniref:RNA polymerase III transcription factor (TF)IIIC subunit HTH domain n=1 Tax=Phytophthora infestans TaxID=4787 RepID=A0A833TPT7_PHYIN|nr:RNA polymerase III transcription factor (TF)IIIC subunit HTH domain [Phytophthora infestans]KAF4145250.1 RNA polymerase III transcription factor (TF)IIIC subunit HTH domain [Phytophthora infestans]